MKSSDFSWVVEAVYRKKTNPPFYHQYITCNRLCSLWNLSLLLVQNMTIRQAQSTVARRTDVSVDTALDIKLHKVPTQSVALKCLSEWKAGPAFRPVWRNWVPRLWGIRELQIFLNIRSVMPHRALGLTLYLNFENIMEDFTKQKARKYN